MDGAAGPLTTPPAPPPQHINTTPGMPGRNIMNTITHTPGPWYVSDADEWHMASGAHAQFGRFDVSAGSCDLSSDNYYRVCSVSNVNNECQNVANARLIAASPDLLGALEMVRDADDDCKRDGMPTIPTAARAKIDEAIAKATKKGGAL